MAAYSFDHGSSKSLGPDLMVSYHGRDNPHYNSVRNKGSPPKRVVTRSYRALDGTEEEEGTSGATEDPSLLPKTSIDPPGRRVRRTKSRYHDEVPLEEKVKKMSVVDRSIKKNSPCPCGSGLRYKKCCLASQKLAVRQERERLKSDLEDREGETSDSPAKSSNASFQTVTI